jgi:hypothetical protein
VHHVIADVGAFFGHGHQQQSKVAPKRRIKR